MAEVGNPIIEIVRDILGPLTKTKWGTKALLAMLIAGAAGYLTYLDKIPGEWCAGVFIAIFVAFSFFRGAQEKREQSNKGEGT